MPSVLTLAAFFVEGGRGGKGLLNFVPSRYGRGGGSLEHLWYLVQLFSDTFSFIIWQVLICSYQEFQKNVKLKL